MKGSFVISLDFELMWGVRDRRTVEEYGENILGVRTALPRLLNLFRQYEIRATFATVGFLFFKNQRELIPHLPAEKPSYRNTRLSSYAILPVLREIDEPYYFAPELLELIKSCQEHEIASHTFSHYYCLEKGQNIAQFRADLSAAKSAAERSGIALQSLVFPRNQFNSDYLDICREFGIIAVRGNENSYFFKATDGIANRVRRGIRLMDAYFNLTGFHCYSPAQLGGNIPVNIPSSRFLRPYNPGLNTLEGLRLQRIRKAMTHAARNSKIFHLWWHPHNFGVHQDKNFAFLEEILQHYAALNKNYDFESLTLSSLAKKIIHNG